MNPRSDIHAHRAFTHSRLVSGGIRLIPSTIIRQFHAREIAPIIFYTTRHISQFNPAMRERSGSKGSSAARTWRDENDAIVQLTSRLTHSASIRILLASLISRFSSPANRERARERNGTRVNAATELACTSERCLYTYESRRVSGHIPQVPKFRSFILGSRGQFVDRLPATPCTSRPHRRTHTFAQAGACRAFARARLRAIRVGGMPFRSR